MNIKQLEKDAVVLLQKIHIPLARFALFLIYFWFGIIKIFELSPASPLAKALVDKTVGASLFHPLFIGLAVIECIIGLLFLFPKFTKPAFILLIAHMAVVCAPIVLVPVLTWQSAFVPTLEGQYIIKNIALVALATSVFLSTVSVKQEK